MSAELENETIEGLHHVTKAIATNPDMMHGGCMNTQRNLLSFLRYRGGFAWEFLVGGIETKAFSESERVHYNATKALSVVCSAFHEDIEENELSLLIMAFVNPSNTECTFEHRLILWKTKNSSSWHCIDAYRYPEVGLDILPSVRTINYEEFFKALKSFFVSSETKWTPHIGVLFSYLCSGEFRMDLTRPDLYGIPFKPVLVCIPHKMKCFSKDHVKMFLREMKNPTDQSQIHHVGQ